MVIDDLVSIIVPAYNVEDFLPRCLQSIMNQTYLQLEIILVDDGSTDGTNFICDEYSKLDSRIKVFHCANSGVSSARNFGLQKINGKWFAFVDGDDWIEPDYIEIMLENAIKYNCSISACQAQFNTQFVMGYCMNDQTKILNGSEECIKNFICSGVSLQGQVWNKLYCSEKYRHVVFDTNLKVNEDCIYTYEIMKKCDSACVIGKELYHWYIRKNSTCHSKEITLDFSAAEVFLMLYKEIEYLHDEIVEQTLMKNYIQEVVRVLLLAKYIGNEESVIFAREQCKQMKSRVWNQFDIKMKIKYLFAIHFPFLRIMIFWKVK